MLKPERIFEEHIKRQLKSSVVLDENEHMRRIRTDFYIKSRLYKNSRPDKQIPEVYLGFINDDCFKALAFKKENQYFIGISNGAIRLLMNFFNYLMSKPYFMKDFGNANLETDQKIDLNPHAKRLIDHFYNFDFSIEPKSIVRKSLSYQLLYKAIHYLVMHEYAHITHGHLDYNIQTDQDFLLFEEDKINNKNTNIRKALEYDADSSATTLNLFPIIFFEASEHNVLIESRLLTIAAYSVFKLPSLIEYKIEDFPKKTYPSPDLRVSNHLALVATYYLENKNEFDFDSEVIIEFCTNLYLDCVKSFGEMFNYNHLNDKSLYYSSMQGYKYQREVSKAWNSIRNDLQLKSFVDIAPEDLYSEENIGFDYKIIIDKRRDKNVDSDSSI